VAIHRIGVMLRIKRGKRSTIVLSFSCPGLLARLKFERGKGVAVTTSAIWFQGEKGKKKKKDAPVAMIAAINVCGVPEN